MPTITGRALAAVLAAGLVLGAGAAAAHASCPVEDARVAPCVGLADDCVTVRVRELLDMSPWATACPFG